MSLLKFVFYSLVAYLVIRMVVRIFFTPKRQNPTHFNQGKNQNSTQTSSNSESLEKPKFTIEAESVDYEVIEEKDEKK